MGVTKGRAFPFSPKAGMQGAVSPLPEREGSSHLPPSLPPSAGQEENGKALP